MLRLRFTRLETKGVDSNSFDTKRLEVNVKVT